MKTPEQSRRHIVEAAVRVVRNRGPMGATTEGIALEAGCAKGLVHYHFRGKDALWNAVILYLTDGRTARWHRAFAATNPDDVIRKTWKAVLQDHESGTVRLISAMSGTSSQADTVIRRVMLEFTELLSREVAALILRVGLTPTIPDQQLGWMLSLAANGAAMQLAAGILPRDLEDAYAATWVGILSLAR